MSGNATSLSELLALPAGGGAQKGLGETFSANPQTGTGSFSVPIPVPPGRNGFQPALSLAYGSGGGNGAFGLGWSLDVPGISRLTSKGVPRYRDTEGEDADLFVLSGAEELVEIERSDADRAAGIRHYRPRTEASFARITRHTRDTDHWEVRSKDGITSIYGTPQPVPADAATDDRAVLADPADRRRVFAWRLSQTIDALGNRIVYDYERETTVDGARCGEQLYLRRVRYLDYDLPGGGSDFLVSLDVLYDTDAPGLVPEHPRRARVDRIADHRAGFEIRTTRRCHGIVLRTHPGNGAPAITVRAHEFVYLDEQRGAAAPLNAVSLLSRINVIGYDDAGQPARELPPLDLGYTHFAPAMRQVTGLAGAQLPTATLAGPDIELVDLFGRGLPDILELGDAARYWRNLGGGRFDRPRLLDALPAGLRLADAGVQLLDADGDGRADLLVTTPALSGYYPLDLHGGAERRAFRRHTQAPSFDLKDPLVRLVDLTGDGVTDALRSGTSFECWFNDARDGWRPERSARTAREGAATFPDVQFSDPRVKFADLCGDGLTDIAVVHRGRVDHWPNLGHGRWGPRVTMEIPEGLPADFDPARVLLVDLDGDGLADLVHVGDRETRLWLNQGGERWSDPVVVRGTPALSSNVAVRPADLLGQGTSGLLWTRDAVEAGQSRHAFLDLTGGSKPYLLARIDNNLGALTEVRYTTSTAACLRDEAQADTRWRTTLPFPVQVVASVAVSDAFSSGTLTTEYRYHHGYWDGLEREFRGFGMVEQVDTEIFDAYTGRGVASDAGALARLVGQRGFAPPLLTRTWFHLGPVNLGADGTWHALDLTAEHWSGDPDQLRDVVAPLADLALQRDAIRALRSRVLRSETYALDASALQELPLSVSESAYGLREVDAPGADPARPRVFFPFLVASRGTQWERGDDPMLRFDFTFDHDDVGQPGRTLSVACPRGTRSLDDAPAAGHIATLTRTTRASGAPDGVFLRDRVACVRSHELTATAGRSVRTLMASDDGQPGLRLFTESWTTYDGDTDAATGFGAFAGLPPGRVGPFGVAVRGETLVLTAAELQRAYGADVPACLLPGGPLPAGVDYPADFVALLPPAAGYVVRDGTGPQSAGHYRVDLQRRFDFHAAAGRGRGVLEAERDPLGHETVVLEHDVWRYLPTRLRDPLGFETRSQASLRTLQPAELVDANGNVTRVRFSPSGKVTDTWGLGKPDAVPGDAANSGDRALAGTHVDYDLRAFHDSRLRDPARPQPAHVRTLRRVFHDGDPDDTGAVIESRDYIDGFGRLLQSRSVGDDVRFGDARFGGGDAVLPADPDAPLAAVVAGVTNADALVPNVVVSGWPVYDNKGRVVQQREPFFDTGWDYAPPTPAQTGRAITMTYDARGELLLATNPDGSQRRVVHGIPHDLADPPLAPGDVARYTPTPWEAYTWDPNDNAGRTHPGAGVRGGFEWHQDTPGSIEVDALGRTIRATARTRATAAVPGTGAPGAIVEHVTRTTYDIQGRAVALRDPLGRLAFERVHDLAGNVLRNASLDAGTERVALDAAAHPLERLDAKGARALHAHDALGRPTHVWARDTAAAALTLRHRLLYDADPAAPQDAARANLHGRLWRQHDEAGIVTTPAYDFRGQALGNARQLLSDDFLLAGVRGHVAGTDWALATPRVDWAQPAADLLEPRTYATRCAHDALGRVRWAEYPPCANGERYRLVPGYDPAGALRTLDLAGPLGPNDRGPTTPFIRHVARDAKGQTTLVALGNGLLTRKAYDPDTFRLVRLRTDRLAAPSAVAWNFRTVGQPLQDVACSHDLAGNLLTLVDRTPGCGVADNPEAVVPGDPLRAALSAGDALRRRFVHDPLYRLVAATGRESTGIPDPRPWADTRRNGYGSGHQGTPDQDSAPTLTSLWSERYDYDAAGNLLSLAHDRCTRQAGQPLWQRAWQRRFGMAGLAPDAWLAAVADHVSGTWDAAPSNQLTHVDETVGAVGATHRSDACGNLLQENAARHFEWDHANRLVAFRTQLGAASPSTYALYLVDAAGQRLKKVVVTGNRYRTTTCIDGTFEHHREVERLDGGGAVAENCSLHVGEAAQRVAVVRVGSAFDDDGAAEHPVQFHVAAPFGTAQAVVSADGDWINREEFFPFGETSFGSFGRKRYRYSGMERDEESGLNHHGARYLALALCRWISADPAGPVDGPNLFVYCSDSPLRFADPSGLAGGEQSGTPPDGGTNLGGTGAADGVPGASYSTSDGNGDQLAGGVASRFEEPPAPQVRKLWDRKLHVCHEQDGTYEDNTIFADRRQAQERAWAAQNEEIRRNGPQLMAGHITTIMDDPFMGQMERTGQLAAIRDFGLFPALGAVAGRAISTAIAPAEASTTAGRVASFIEFPSGLPMSRIPVRVPITGDLGVYTANLRKNLRLVGGDIAVGRYVHEGEEGILFGLSTTNGVHAERQLAAIAEALGIPGKAFVEVFSELNFCTYTLGGGCRAFVQDAFPLAEFTYSFEYGVTKASRAAGVADLVRRNEGLLAPPMRINLLLKPGR